MKIFIGFILIFSCNITFAKSDGIAFSIPEICGYSDDLYQQIPVWSHNKSILNLGFSGKQGETGRRLIMYADQTWILTVEFFFPEDTQYDLSCVVLNGAGEEAYDSIHGRLAGLPSKWWGRELRLQDKARLHLN